MGKWEMVRLGDVLDYEQPTKYIVESTDYDDAYTTPVLTAGQSFVLGYTSETDNIFVDLPVIIFDDFTTAIKYVDFPFKVKSSAMKILRPTPAIDLKYMFYYMNTITVDTGLHKRYWISKYAEMRIPLPPLPVQQQIVDVLDRASALIEKRKAQIEKLDLLVKSQFIEMFGDPVTNPMGWRKCKLGDVAEAVDPQPSHRTPPISDDGIPYIGIAECDYKTREVKFDLARKVGQNVLEEQKNRYSISNGDFIIGKIGTIGKPFFIPSKQTYTLSANIVLIKPEPERITPMFLFMLFQSNLIENQLAIERKATSQPAFGIQKVRNIDIVYPPLSIQSEFAVLMQQIETQKKLLQQSLAKLEQNYKSLIQKCFRGEIF